MENFGEKMERKTFLSVFGWVERKKNKWWGLGVFSPGPLKRFLPKIERKVKGEIGHHFWMKMPMCNCTRALSTLLFFTLFFFPLGCYLLFFLMDDACLFFLFFLLSFALFFLFRCDFFLWTWFLFFNKIRWLILFGCLSLFWF